jgi:hypothetical protein
VYPLKAGRRARRGACKFLLQDLGIRSLSAVKQILRNQSFPQLL